MAKFQPRSSSPMYISTPIGTRQNHFIPSIIKPSLTNSINIRAASVSPFRQVSGLNFNTEVQRSVREDETVAFWKNKYESLNAIYQLEIDELRRFYSSQNSSHLVEDSQSKEIKEEIEQLRKDNKILSEYIQKKQDDIEKLVNENMLLQEKIAINNLNVEKINELINKNYELNCLMDRKTEEIAEMMLTNSKSKELIAERNEEILHLKTLLAQIIQDNDRLSEIIEPLKSNLAQVSNELEITKNHLNNQLYASENMNIEIQTLKEANNELRLENENLKKNGLLPTRDENPEDYPKNDFLLQNFKELKEENYKLKEQIQGYYGDILLLKEREKIFKGEMEKIKKNYNPSNNIKSHLK